MGQKLRRKMHEILPQLLVAGPLILHDNARMYITGVVTKILRKYGRELLPHELYSPDISPQDFNLFAELKNLCVDNVFLLWKTLYPSYSTHEKIGILGGIIMLPKRWDLVVEKQGDYIEGLWTDNLKEIKVLLNKYPLHYFWNGLRRPIRYRLRHSKEHLKYKIITWSLILSMWWLTFLFVLRFSYVKIRIKDFNFFHM